MGKIRISLDSFEKVKDFIKVAHRLDCNLSLASEHFAVNGNSVIGIFALDLSKTIEVSIPDGNQDTLLCQKELEEFIIKA